MPYFLTNYKFSLLPPNGCIIGMPASHRPYAPQNITGDCSLYRLIEFIFPNPKLFSDICLIQDGLVSSVLSRHARHVGTFFGNLSSSVKC